MERPMNWHRVKVRALTLTYDTDEMAYYSEAKGILHT